MSDNEKGRIPAAERLALGAMYAARISRMLSEIASVSVSLKRAHEVSMEVKDFSNRKKGPVMGER